MKSVRGVSTVEFLLGVALVLLPLSFAILEFAQLTAARNALNFAAFEAARAGSMTGIDRGAMRAALARGIAPILDGGAFAADSDVLARQATLARAFAEATRPDLMRMTIENPTAAAFEDFAAYEDGRRVIPNDGLEFRNPWGPRSNQTLRDANVLALRVRYCRVLVMPLTAQLIPLLLRPFAFDAADQVCLAQGRLPIEAAAVVHMQSAATSAGGS
jgi:hypothetical protein